MSSSQRSDTDEEVLNLVIDVCVKCSFCGKPGLDEMREESMITNSERREAAAELRRFSEEGSPADVIYGGTEYYYRMLVRVLRQIVGKGDLFETLADLVDRPTCHNVLDEVNTFECSECHWSFYTENPNGGWEEPCYCIHCGAEVVENAD